MSSLLHTGFAPVPPRARTRPAAGGTWQDGPEDIDDSMANVMAEVARALAADSLLVAWHDGDAQPRLLFENGNGERRPLLLAAAADAAEQPARAPQTCWSALADDADGALLTTSIGTGGGVVTITSLFAHVGETTRGHVREAIARLLPLVQPFLRLWSARGRERARARGLAAAVDTSDVGVLLVDREGQPIFANAAADAIIAQGDGLRRRGGMLGGLRLADTLRLQAAIEHVLQAAPGSTASAPVVALPREMRRPLLAAVVGHASAAGRDDSAATIYLFDPEQDLRPLVEPACKLYGLSPVETRLTCLLAEGVGFADAAEKLHVREQTARSYLKQVFQKTRTNRQAELVWLMLASSVRTAPACHAQFV